MGLQTFNYGLRDMKIADWVSENSYGTEYDVLGARSMNIAIITQSDEARGDDAVLDQFSKIVAVEVTWEQATLDLEGFSILTDGVLVSNADYEDLVMDGNFGYIAMAGRVVSSDSSNDFHILVPKAKISGNLQFQAQQDSYLFPNATFRGVREGDTNKFIRMRNFTGPTTLSIPLATAVD